MNAKTPVPRTGGLPGKSDDREFRGARLTGAVVSCFVHTRSVRRKTVEETQGVVIERRARWGASRIG